MDNMAKDYAIRLEKLETEKLEIRNMPTTEDTPQKKTEVFINDNLPDVQTPIKSVVKWKLLEHNVLTESLKLKFNTSSNADNL